MFLNLVFPDRIGRNSTISSTFDTYIEQNGFFEKRNSRYSFSRIVADLSFNLRRKDEILELKSIHEKARGSGFSFKFSDFTYNSTNSYTQKPTPVDFKISQTKNELLSKSRLYDKNGKIIQLPEEGTFFISYIRNDVFVVYTDIENNQENIEYIQSSILENFGSAYDDNIEINFKSDIVNYENGKFTESFKDIIDIENINEDVGIYSGFKFFLKVRFESDEFSVVHNGYDSWETPSCRLVEVFE